MIAFQSLHGKKSWKAYCKLRQRRLYSLPMLHEATIISRSGNESFTSGELPGEFPLRLIVNGSELATLIVSPHDLRFLVAGFLRMQGYVRSSEDFEMLSVCEDMAIANVRIKGDLPQRVAPVLTSGCGTGISFTLPTASTAVKPEGRCRSFTPEEIFAVFDELARQAKRYRSHGGIHSAAVSDGRGLILHSEDLGRHNTIDRLAGEALLRGIDLAGMILITSGRISSEMAAKASQLGISVVASRTSPTDMAVRICKEANIALIGYVRGDRFTVYAHPERICTGKIRGVTGVILAGGASRRMGTNKALLDVHGEPMIQRIYRTLAEIFIEVIVVTNEPERYTFLPCRKVNDLWPGTGTMVGIHAGLAACEGSDAFVVGCDMPFLKPSLIRHLVGLKDESDVVVPRTPDGLQPLHALYRRSSIRFIERYLQKGDLSMMHLLAELRTRQVTPGEIECVDHSFSSFINVNTLEEYDRHCSGGQKLSADS